MKAKTKYLIQYLYRVQFASLFLFLHIPILIQYLYRVQFASLFLFLFLYSYNISVECSLLACSIYFIKNYVAAVLLLNYEYVLVH